MRKPQFLFLLGVIFITIFTRGCSEQAGSMVSVGFPFPWMGHVIQNGYIRVWGLVDYWYIAFVLDAVFFYWLWKKYKDIVKVRVETLSFFVTAVWVTAATSIMVLPSMAESGLGMLTVYLIFFPLSALSSGIDALGIMPMAWRLDSFIAIDITARLQYIIYVALAWFIYTILRELLRKVRK